MNSGCSWNFKWLSSLKFCNTSLVTDTPPCMAIRSHSSLLLFTSLPHVLFWAFSGLRQANATQEGTENYPHFCVVCFCCFGPLCQFTDVPNRLQSLHKAARDWDGVKRRKEHENATLSFLAEMSWCSHGLGLVEGIDLFVEEDNHSSVHQRATAEQFEAIKSPRGTKYLNKWIPE